MKDTSSQVLELRIVEKFSREFSARIRPRNCQIGMRVLNSLENFLIALMVKYTECLSEFGWIGG